MSSPLLWLVFFLSTRAARAQFSFSIRGSSSTAVLGSPYSFTCVQSGPLPGTLGQVISFVKDGTRTYCSALRTQCNSSFPQGASCGCVDSSGGTYTYRYNISSVGMEHSGSWRCRIATLTGNIDTDPLNLAVAVAPNISALGDLNLTVTEGQPLNLTCQSTGTPRPRVTWSHPGSTAQVNVTGSVSQSSLTLTPDRRRGGSSQTVTCTGSSRAGQASASFSLLLLYPPSGPPVISGLPPDGALLRDHDVTLTCRVTGGSPPVSNVTLTCPRHSNTSQGDVTSLVFTAGEKDQGSCMCSASHVLDYTLTASVNITVHWPPSPPTGLQVLSVTSHTVTLTWLTGDTGCTQERWYQVDFRPLVAPGDGWREGGRVSAPGEEGVRVGGQVGGLSPLTAYVIRVTGRNSQQQQHGDVSNSSAEVAVKTSAVPVNSCDVTAPVAASVVVTFFVSVISTLAVGYVVHRHRQRGPREGSKSDVYENAGLDVEMTSAAAGGGSRTSPSGGATSSAEREEGGYGVLDPHSRERPRDVTDYQALAPRPHHGNQPSRDSARPDNENYTNVPEDGAYSNITDL